MGNSISSSSPADCQWTPFQFFLIFFVKTSTFCLADIICIFQLKWIRPTIQLLARCTPPLFGRGWHMAAIHVRPNGHLCAYNQSIIGLYRPPSAIFGQHSDLHAISVSSCVTYNDGHPPVPVKFEVLPVYGDHVSR